MAIDKPQPSQPSQPFKPRLQPRMMEVLRLAAEGLNNKAIAERTGLMVSTVENHLQVIYRTLDVQQPDQNSRVAACRWYWFKP